MAKCKRCGKKGVFLKLNSKGICSNCVDQQELVLERVMGQSHKTSVIAKTSIMAQLKEIKAQQENNLALPTPHQLTQPKKKQSKVSQDHDR